ncbi:MAG TPA: sigma-54 dependent transcriptional regulator [Spirochaetota bacterium]|jgi:two-component system nitrogen regulation response regulator NtrX|nr:sigma-54 dependent transcriptional regulator [Spirochaetota bacterium]HOH36478.1 sigma-54 dependent transcriptional regulator [Spirochaetota bacterium]HPJ14013.1 sigma-54 dependent transcriptional regulator [Spirochaetota bacterium]HPM33367.1 sigma-54 dependent transcriptional regulator [Spirochaetota bacterium]
MAKIFLVDDEPNIIKVLSQILQDEEHIIFSASNGTEALEFLKKNEPDLIFLDVWLPDADGLQLLETIKKEKPDIAVIMISGHGSIDIAVKSTKIGAYDFLEKPPSLERVVTVVNNALESVRLRRENLKLRKESRFDDEMIGKSALMEEIREIIDKAAATNARVFITGKNGTGKELIAKAIYRKSKRSDKPFIKVNCAAIPDELIESELFGHEKGAFTGAVARRIGKFEQADGGTLFLDEICDMSASAQAKVLRVLQEQELERVGGTETIKVDVRIISATNIDVKKAVEKNEFREDLYYRLNVIPIHIPSLSERKDDIPDLVCYFMKKFSEEHGIVEKRISAGGMDFLSHYTWPGNIRELKNLMERASIMIPSDEIGADDLKKYIEANESYQEIYMTDKSSLKLAKEDFEKKYIESALEKNKGNITLTAKDIGIERTNLHRKIKQYNIENSGYSDDE